MNVYASAPLESMLDEIYVAALHGSAELDTVKKIAQEICRRADLICYRLGSDLCTPEDALATLFHGEPERS